MKKTLILTFELTPRGMADAAKDFEIVRAETIADVTRLAKEKSADAILVSMGLKFGRAEAAALPESVKVVATGSVGFDHLDVDALKAHGIVATNTPDVLTDATADLALLLLLGACRRVRDSIHLVEGGWGKKIGFSQDLGVDPKGKKLGILGMGRIGQAVAKRARAFGMEILYSNRHRLPAELEQGATYFSDFREMLPHSQILSLHAPGTPETENIMSDEEFALLPSGAVFINVARGTLVDEEALFEALDSGHLFAAGLDVCRNEPNPDIRLIGHSRILLTPHVGSATRETRDAMGLRALENIRAVLKGERPRDQLSI